jgi:uncharacterized membrane protein YvbJ
MPYCTNCGIELSTTQEYCSYCGRKQKLDQNQQAYYQNTQITSTNAETKSSAITCAIIGLFFAGIILGIIAISLSNNPNQSNRKAAKVLGVIDIFAAIVSIYLMIYFS